MWGSETVDKEKKEKRKKLVCFQSKGNNHPKIFMYYNIIIEEFAKGCYGKKSGVEAIRKININSNFEW